MRALLLVGLLASANEASATLIEMTQSAYADTGEFVVLHTLVDTNQMLLAPGLYPDSFRFADYIDLDFSVGTVASTLTINGIEAAFSGAGTFNLFSDLESPAGHTAEFGFNFDGWSFTFPNGSVQGGILVEQFNAWPDPILGMLENTVLTGSVGSLWHDGQKLLRFSPSSQWQLTYVQVPTPGALALLLLGLPLVAVMRRSRTRLASSRSIDG